MEKLVKNVNVGAAAYFDADYLQKGTEISELTEFLNDASKDGATHIEWRASADSDGSSEGVEIQPFYKQVESDAEFEVRKDRMEALRKAQADAAIERDRNLYEALKQKFEPKTT